jgi:hypothetical protein
MVYELINNELLTMPIYHGLWSIVYGLSHFPTKNYLCRYDR